MKLLAAFALTIGLVIGIEFAQAGVWPLSCVFGFIGLAGCAAWAFPAISHDIEEHKGRRLTYLTIKRDRSWYPNYQRDDNPTADHLRHLDEQIKDLDA